MKPFAVRLSAKETFDNGASLTTILFGRGQNLEQKAVVTSFAEIDTLAAALAAERNKAPFTQGEKGAPGTVIWCGMAERGQRKPAGFEAYARALSVRFFPAPQPAVTS